MEYGSIEPFLKCEQRRSSNANSLWWRVLATPTGVIHGSRTAPAPPPSTPLLVTASVRPDQCKPAERGGAAPEGRPAASCQRPSGTHHIFWRAVSHSNVSRLRQSCLGRQPAP